MAMSRDMAAPSRSGRGRLIRGAGLLVFIAALGAGIGWLVTLSPPLAFAAAAALVAAFVYIRFREFGILTVFFVVPLGPLLWITPDGLISVQKLLIAGLTAVWIAQLLVAKDKAPFREFTRTGLNAWGLFFLPVFLMALPWCLEKDTALLLIFRWATHLALLYFLVFNVRTHALLRRSLAAILCIGFLISLIATWEYYSQKSILEMTGKQVLGREAQLIKGEESGVLVSSKEKTIRPGAEAEWARSMATFKGPNELGLFLVFVCGVAIFFMFRPKGSRLAALAAGAVLLLAVLSINFTGSRGALSGILALIGVFILLQRFPFKWFVISAGAAALLIFLTSPGNLGAQWRGGLNWQMITQETRVQWLQMSVDMMTDYPIAGIGLGQFEPRYFEYKIPGTQKLSEPPHNIVSQIMAENGLLGVALLAFMVFVIIRESQRLRLRPLEEDDEILGSVLLSIFAGMMAFAMTSNVLLDETYWTFLALVAISSSLYAARREAAVPPPEVGREVVVVLPRGGPGA